MRSTANSYLAAQVQTASPPKLRLMLIEAALRHATRARELLVAGQADEATEAIIRCQEIVGELMASVDRQRAPALGAKIVSLYLFLHGRLVAAAVEHDAERLADVIRILQIERDTWRQVCQQ